jgi:Tol biopolymer transport system component
MDAHYRFPRNYLERADERIKRSRRQAWLNVAIFRRAFLSSTFLIGLTVLGITGWVGGCTLGQKANINLIVFEKWLPFPDGHSWGKEVELWIVRSDGTGLERLTSGFRDEHTAWSPDRQRIAFVRNGRVLVLNVKDRTLRELTFPARYPSAAYPQWISNGAIVYSVLAGDEEDNRRKWRLHTYSFETETAFLMPAGGLSGVFIAKVSPNLQFITFHASDGIRDSLYLADARDITKTRRILLEENVYPETWTPDSKSIVFFYWGACSVVNTDGRVNGFFATDVDECNLSWSPDGRSIAFQHKNAIWIMDSEGKYKKSLVEPTDNAHLRSPAWS